MVHMKLTILASLVFGFLLFLFLLGDKRDRDFLCDSLKCNRASIERQFFHFYGESNRVYKVNGETWIVNGLFFIEGAKVTL